MRRRPVISRYVLVLVLVFGAVSLANAGPPFLTDDPEPIEYRHSEAYMFSTMDNAPGGKTAVIPAFEFNTGPAPDWHFHAAVPLLALWPDNGGNAHGLGDIELGVKYRFVHESGNMPQMAIYPTVELPTGDANKGLGNGRAWGLFPLWLQKSWGPWTTYGGGGAAFNSAPGMKNYSFAGWLLQRAITDSLTLGGEFFYQGVSRVGGQESTLFNIGGNYSAIRICGGCSLLFRMGASIAGEVHHEAYLGLYWTWGPGDRT